MSRQGKIGLIVIGVIIIITGAIALGFYNSIKSSADQNSTPAFGTIKTNKIVGLDSAKPSLGNANPNTISIDKQRSTLLGFEIPANIANENLDQASLLVYVKSVTNYQNTGSNHVDIYSIASPWDESATAANQPDYSEQPVAAASFDQIISSKAYSGWVSIDINSEFQSWLKSPQQNYGLRIGPATSGISVELANSANSAPMIQYSYQTLAAKPKDLVIDEKNLPANQPQIESKEKLTIGSSGHKVVKLQDELKAKGLLDPDRKTTDYDIAVYQAVKKAQEQLGLPSNGKADQNTINAISGQQYQRPVSVIAKLTIIPQFIPDKTSDNFWLRSFAPGILSINDYKIPLLDQINVWTQ